MEGVVKRFGGTLALDRASLHVRPGTVHAVLGENGAGKTTLMRIAFGMVRADAGIVRLDGRPVEIRSPSDAIAAGLGMVHQHFALIPGMSVAENIALGGHGLYSASQAAHRARHVAQSTGLALDPGSLAGELSVGGQQRLEIVKALARDARLLVLDEPTAVLAPAEAEELLLRLRAFADTGRTVVLVTHRLREALSVADDVTVLRHGATVVSSPSSATSERQLIAAILGGESRSLGRGSALTPPAETGAADAAIGATAKAGEPSTKCFVGLPEAVGNSEAVISAHRLAVADAKGTVRVRDASLDVAAGEMVGIAAVDGAGQRELLRALAGRLAPASGTLLRPERVGFVPEDRQGDALILDFSLSENLHLRDAGRERGTIDWAALEARTAALLSEHDIRAAGPRAAASTLSGGNQQKFVIARELEDAPLALVVENPTRGLDIKAAEAVRARLRAAAAGGTAVVIYSSDLDEVLALANRVLVVFDGSVNEAPHDRDIVGRRMLGLP